MSARSMAGALGRDRARCNAYPARRPRPVSRPARSHRTAAGRPILRGTAETLLAYLATRGAASRALIMVTSMIFFCVRSFPLPRCRPQNRVVMSMLPQPWPEVPADTARVARRAFRKGTLAMRAREELGLVKAGGRQRTDSTHVLARIRGLNRLELAGETVRAALEALAAAVPDWLAGVIDESWQQVYGQRIDQIRLPTSETARGKLAVQYGKDGYHLLEAASAPGAPDWLRQLPAVAALRAIWVQQYYRGTDEHGE